MKFKIKGFIITGIILLIIGVSTIVYGYAKADFNYKNLSSEKNYELKQYETEMVENISVSNKVDDVIIKYDSTKTKIEIKYSESDVRKYNIEVVDGTLTVKQTTSKNNISSFINLFYKENKFEILLPSKKLENIKVSSTTGIVKVDNIESNDCTISGKNDFIKITNSIFTNLNIDFTNGNCELKNVTASLAKINFTNGNCELNNININIVDVDVTNGNCEFEKSIISSLTVDLTNGNVEYEGQIKVKIYIDVTAGDIDVVLDQAEGDPKIDVKLDCSVGKQKIKYLK